MKILNNNIEETYVSCELAKILKEKGFRCKTFDCYSIKDQSLYELKSDAPPTN